MIRKVAQSERTRVSGNPPKNRQSPEKRGIPPKTMKKEKNEKKLKRKWVCVCLLATHRLTKKLIGLSSCMQLPILLLTKSSLIETISIYTNKHRSFSKNKFEMRKVREERGVLTFYEFTKRGRERRAVWLVN